MVDILKQITPKEAYDLFNPDVVWGRVYTSYFGKFPSMMAIHDIDPARVIDYLKSTFADKQMYVHKRDFIHQKWQLKCDETAYIYSDEVIVLIQVEGQRVEIYYSLNETQAKTIFNQCTEFIVEQTNKHIFLITRDFGLSLQPLVLKEIPMSLEDNYNDDLRDVHGRIETTLSEEDTSALVLLYGAPGTGKSTYIRHLIYHSQKKVIFLPPNLAGNLDSPELISLIMANRNSIVIIEDAEELIVSRENSRNSCISMLLNLTDGLLGYCLGIQFICTFNTHLANIDKALLRKGRLSALYEFKPLSPVKSKALLEKLGKSTNGNFGSMTLAEIYNADSTDYRIEPVKNAIGFNSNSLNI